MAEPQARKKRREKSVKVAEPVAKIKREEKSVFSEHAGM